LDVTMLPQSLRYVVNQAWGRTPSYGFLV